MIILYTHIRLLFQFVRHGMRKPYIEHTNPFELIALCPLCQARYEPYFAKMLKSSPEAHLWHVMCRHCLHAMMIVVMFDEQGIDSVGLVTDLSSDEVLRLSMSQTISTDDCIEVHTLLNKYPF